jgi:hypothetical protein
MTGVQTENEDDNSRPMSSESRYSTYVTQGSAGHKSRNFKVAVLSSLITIMVIQIFRFIVIMNYEQQDTLRM